MALLGTLTVSLLYLRALAPFVHSCLLRTFVAKFTGALVCSSLLASFFHFYSPGKLKIKRQKGLGQNFPGATFANIFQTVVDIFTKIGIVHLETMPKMNIGIKNFSILIKSRDRDLLPHFTNF